MGPSRDRAPCPIVGVGASAGGLEALQGLFARLPGKPGLAFVVVQHRAANRASVLKSLLEMHTKLAVKDIEEGMKIEPDTIYLAPAEKNVSIRNDVLYLTEAPRGSGVHLPIDSFFRTLSRDKAERAICIVLSGTGSDGTLGLKEIKAAGGMAMVQKEDQAKYDSMPRSAIETGMVDFILPVEEMGEQLMQYIRHPYLEPRKAAELEEPFENQLQKILLLIRQRTGHDFSHYRRNTIRRRLATRLAVHHIQNLDRYLKLLRESPAEAGILARAMLITVTSFFRDREAWEALSEQVIRPLVKRKPSEMPLRAWVAGCATGEEAYTLAILFHELMEKGGRFHTPQIFASDLDEESLNTARRGVYPKSIAADVSQERLRRFFTDEGDRYRIKSNTRESIVFAQHDLTKNAPFSKLDLVCCRNVLIYMDSSLQEKLLPMLHYGLNPDGILFLGESESIGRCVDLFAPVDTRHKIFRRKLVTTGHAPETVEPRYRAPEEAGPRRPRAARTASNMAEIAERMILRDLSWPCVLIDEDYNIVYFSGDTGKYLDLPKGKAAFNVLQMARPEIHFKLDLLLKRAFQERHTVVEEGIPVRMNDHYLQTDITVRPVTEAGVADNLMLVVFQGKPSETAAAPTGLPEQEKNGRLRALEQELQATRQNLQTTIEELQTSNEELKSSNEELQSTNEEYQTTNEELNTSREELQSVNEELRTLNTEYQQRIEEQSRAYDDLANLLGATEIATVFLDRDLKIRRFTPAACKIFRLMDRDVGRPLDDITTNLQYQGFSQEIRRVLETPTRVEKEVMLVGGAWYEMRIFPYRTAADVLDGVVIIFVDTSKRKQMENALRQSEERFRAFVTAGSDVVYRMSPDWSEMRELRGREFLPDTESPSRTWLEKYIDPEDQPHVLAVINEAIRTKSMFALEHRVRRADGSLGWTSSRAVPLLDEKGEIVEWVGTARDITERKRAAQTPRE